MVFEDYNPNTGCQEVLARYVVSQYSSNKLGKGLVSDDKVKAAMRACDIEDLVSTLLEIQQYESDKDEPTPENPTIFDIVKAKLTPGFIKTGQEFINDVREFKFSDLLPTMPDSTKTEKAVEKWKHRKPQLADSLIEYVDSRLNKKLWDEIEPYANYMSKNNHDENIHQECIDGINGALNHTDIPHVLSDNMAYDFNVLSLEHDYNPEIKTPFFIGRPLESSQQQQPTPPPKAAIIPPVSDFSTLFDDEPVKSETNQTSLNSDAFLTPNSPPPTEAEAKPHIEEENPYDSLFREDSELPPEKPLPTRTDNPISEEVIPKNKTPDSPQK